MNDELHETKEQLRRTENLLNLVLRAGKITAARVDTDLRHTWVYNSNPEGLTEEEIIGQRDDELFPPEVAEPTMEIKREALETGEPFTREITFEKPDGDRIYQVSAEPTRNTEGDVDGVMHASIDITAQKKAERNERLAALNEFARALTAAESAEEVCATAVETARETLDLPVSTVELYDEATGRLDPVARTSAVSELVTDDSLFASDHDIPWEVYADQAPRFIDDLDASSAVPDDETQLRSAIVLPIGRYGVFISGATKPAAFRRSDRQLAQILVANTEAALDRVRREEDLRDRAEELEAQAATLERVNRINAVIRDLTHVLTQATTRAEVEKAVCTRLASTDPHQFAWIGSPDSVGGTLTPRTSAGVVRGYLDALVDSDSRRTSAEGPADRAARTRELQVVNNLNTDPPFDPWQVEALERGWQACIAIPLTHRDTLYGVLTIYADSPGSFEELEATVLAELGEMIGYAINALERKKALVSDRAVELQFDVSGASISPMDFAAATDSRITFESFVEGAHGTLRGFFTVTGASPDTVIESAKRLPGIPEVTHIGERESGHVFEAGIAESSFVADVFEYGARVVGLDVTADGGTLTVELAQSSDIRSFLDMIISTYPTMQLVARRELDRPIQTEAGFRRLYMSRLTERQEEVLRTAYFAGFFESPRESSGSDIADILDVSQPTVNRHIREGEHKLFELIFGGGADVPDD